jgi:putative hydrolase of the HAD superfamily
LTPVDFTAIKNIVFDLGGVLFEVDYHRCITAFENLRMKNFDSVYSQAQQAHIFDELEKGKLPVATFRNFIRENVGNQLPDEQIDSAWCAMLIGMPAYKFETLKKLQPHFRLFLLSNTNAIHLPEVHRMIATQTPGKSLAQSFEKCYYSNEVSMRKPDAEIFEMVLAAKKLIASETLFIDDSPQHIAGADKCGIQTSLITKTNNTEVLFAAFL